MSEQIGELSRILAEKVKAGQAVQTVFATVKAVDWEKKTLTAVGIVDDLDFHDVLCGLGEIYTRPEVGAKILIGSIGNRSENSFLIWSEASEEMEHKVGDAFLNMKKEGFAVKVKNESLKKVLNDFIDEVNKIIVVNGTTINVAAVTAIKQRLNLILIE